MIVKGYYNVNNGVFLGMMTATNESTGVATTPRYVEGCCFGEYNTETHEFVPMTNPMVIPKGAVFTQDEQLNDRGQNTLLVSGIEEDKGADFVSKKLTKGFSLNVTPNVETRDNSGKLVDSSRIIREPAKTEPKQIAQVTDDAPGKLPVDALQDINWDNLF